MGWPMVAASMPAVRFSGEGKQRGDWGVKTGESAAPFLGEEGSSGRWQRVWVVAAAALGRASEGRRHSQAADRAGQPVSEGEAAG
jgi:hypothetical protein